MRTESPEQWFKSNEFTCEFEFSPIAAEYLVGSEFVDVETVYHDDTDELRRVTFPSGAELVAHDKLWRQTSGPRLYCRQPPEAGPTEQDIAIAFWSGGDAVELVRRRERRVLETFDAGEVEYEGPDVELIEDLRPWIDAGHNRFVFLHGRQNRGMTTFCKHAAGELGRRILLLDGFHVRFRDLAGWTEVIRLASPDVVIVDKFGVFAKGGRPVSEERPFSDFAEQCTNVDLTLFAGFESADPKISQLPDGIVDEIHAFEGIEEDTYTKRVLELAEEYGADVPEEKLPELTEIAKDFRGSWVVEAFKRAELYGWEELDFDPYEYSMEAFLHPNTWWEGWKTFSDFDALRPAEFLWKKHTDILQLDWHEGRFGAGRIEVEDVTYYGPHRSIVDTVRDCVSEAMPRDILLRAPAGAGMETLALNVVESVSDRTIVMEPEAVRRIEYEQWERLLEDHDPALVIFTDVTPDHSSETGRKLRELQRAGLPMALYLSREPEEWSLQAEEAYGFHHVEHMQKPEREDRIRVIDKFAQEARTYIPKKHYDFLDTLYVERSPGRAREAILRAGRTKWHRIDEIAGDSTFDRKE